MRCWPFFVALLLCGPALAGPQDAWTIDQRASSLTFSASQVGSVVNGRFPAWTARIVLDPASLGAARIEVRIEMPQATTNNRDVDSLMKGANFLDVRSFPEARFVSTQVVAKGSGRYEALGKLTVRDVTRDAVLPFMLTIADDPAEPGRLRATARGRLVLQRLDFGIGQNEWAATGQLANEVTVDLNVAATRGK